MGICGFKGNNGGVHQSIVEISKNEDDNNPPPLKPKLISSAQEGETGKANMDSTKQLANGEHSIEELKDKDNQSEVGFLIKSAFKAPHKENKKES